MRNGQVSLEYATTYGWALVIMLIIIGSLIFYGFVETNSHIKTNCYIGPQFICEDVYLTPNGELGIKFINNINEKITLQEVTLDNFNKSTCTMTSSEIKSGHEGIIQCELGIQIYGGDLEEIHTTSNFTINGTKDPNNNEIVFFAKGKVLINVNEKLVKLAMCDMDGDGYESEIVGCDATDCDDTDKSWYRPECIIEDGCPISETCIGEGECRAYCISESCDLDKDNHVSTICGGIDQCDNQASIIEPICLLNSECGINEYCADPGICNSECKPCDGDGDGENSLICGGIDQCDNKPLITKPACSSNSECGTKTLPGLCYLPGTCNSYCEGPPDVGG